MDTSELHKSLKDPYVLRQLEEVLNQHNRLLCTCLLPQAVIQAGKQDILYVAYALQEFAKDHKSLAIVDNRIMFVTDDDGMGRVLKKGEYDKDCSLLAEKFLEEGMHALDIGANCGYYTLLLSSLVGESGGVCAFEPDPVNYSFLDLNTRVNNIKNARILSCAVSDIAGMGSLYLSGEGNFGDHRTWQIQAKPGENIKLRDKSVPIQKVCLDDIIKSIPVHFMKIDTQGDEVRVLKGADNLFRNNKDMAILTELWPWGIDQSCASLSDSQGCLDLIDILHKHGFHLALWSNIDNKGYRYEDISILKNLIEMNRGDYRNLVEMIAVKGYFEKYLG